VTSRPPHSPSRWYQVGWALIPAAIASAILVVRTIFEDRMLRNELAGYKEYAARVRYRLIPGVW
jgi:protein-S-isoprenylcysteine O-methyltransferase Ste14